MNYSDDKTTADKTRMTDGEPDGIFSPETIVAADGDGVTAAEQNVGGAEHTSVEDTRGASPRGEFAEELIKISVKAAAVALSLVMLITSILTVAMPLSAMRIFNKLGMSERALASGGSYISARLDAYDANKTDELGNYVALSRTPELTDAEFIEALDVCIKLSYDLTEGSHKSGDVKSAAYFAERLERYTRIYASLNGVRTVNAKKDETNVLSVPMHAMRPYVYDYAHTVAVLNYRARIYLGELDRMLYDSGRDGDCVQTLANRSQTYGSVVEKPISVIDGFVDYLAQLGEYLSIELDKLGVESGLNELVVGSKYNMDGDSAERDPGFVMTSDTFSLFMTPTDGFTGTYNYLKNFREFAQAAVDFVPTTVDEHLHRLFWLRVMMTESRKLWDMSMLMYYNTEAYGGVGPASIRDEYVKNTCALYQFVEYEGRDRLISEIYDIYFGQYLALYK